MSYIDNFSEFLFDEHRRLSSKAAVVVFIILSILFVDNILGFSYSFSLDKKIEQVQKLNSIIKDSTIDSTTKSFALNLRSQIIERENIVAQTLSFFRGKSNSSIKHQANNPPAIANPIDDASIKNNFWFNISAGGLFYLFAFLLIPVMVFTDIKTSFPQRIATGILSSALFFGLGWFFYWVCDFIPQISNSTWAWNYVLNAAIQVLLIGLLVAASQKKR